MSDLGPGPDRWDGPRPVPGRRLALLLAGDAQVVPAAAAELRRLRAALGPGLAGARTSRPPATNPMAGTGSMMASSDFAVALEVDLSDEVSDDEVVDAVAGLSDRHQGAIDRQTSAVLLGRVHVLRDRPVPAAPPALKVMVVVQGPAGLSAAEVHAAWLEVGRVNARNHPTCAHYSQLHADPVATARATVAAGYASDPPTGMAVEVFPTAADLHAGHTWAASPASVDGARTDAAHLMEMLGRCLDFSTARTLLAADPPP